MTSAPNVRDMFPHAHSAAERAQAFEDYKKSLDDAYKSATAGNRRYVQGEGFRTVAGPSADLQKAAKQLKKLQKGAAADVAAELAQLNAYITKEIDSNPPTLGNTALGQTQGFVPVDLEAPSKKLVPLQTPLRNMLPRNNSGKGTGLSFRRVRGWSNSNSSSGVGDMSSFFSSENENTSYAGVAAIRRPNQISYATDVNTIAYVEQGLGTSVSWRAEYAGQGFEDIRQLAQTALLWSTMTAEEKNLLYGRGASANGYAGAVTPPTFGTPTATGITFTGGSFTAGTYYIYITASSGAGETAPVNATAGTAVVLPAGKALAIPVSTTGAGTLGFNVYVGTANSATTAFYQGTFNPVIVGGTSTIVVTGTYNAAGAVPTTADTSSNAFGYDGLLTLLTNTAGAGNGQGTGYFSQFTGSQYNSTANGILAVGDAPFQAAFSALYGATTQPNTQNVPYGSTYIQEQGAAFGQKLLADPDCVLLDGQVRSALGTYLKATASTTAYRFMLTAGDQDGARVGSVVNGIYNQVTGKMVDLIVEPYMPLGSSVILSKTLPVPDSEISNTFEVRNVQDYMAYEWAPIGMTYDSSTYMFGTLVPYAPAWSGAITGLQP